MHLALEYIEEFVSFLETVLGIKVTSRTEEERIKTGEVCRFFYLGAFMHLRQEEEAAVVKLFGSEEERKALEELWQVYFQMKVEEVDDDI